MFGYDGTAAPTAAVTQHIKNIRAKLRAAAAGQPGKRAENRMGSWIFMERTGRRLTSLRSVLLRYLCLCGGGCALILVLWWGSARQLNR